MPFCFERIVEDHSQAVFQYIYRLVQKQDAAEELTLQVFQETWQRAEPDLPARGMRVRLFRDATERAFRWLRHSAPYAEAGLPQPAVARALAHLPEKERAAVILHKYAGLTEAEIATVLAGRESAIQAMVGRAYENIRGLMRVPETQALPFSPNQSLSPLPANSSSAMQ